MRIVKSERVILSQVEHDIWCEFDILLSGLARGIENPNAKKMVLRIQELLGDLYEAMDVEVE
jgi:hypothetical protein